MGLNEFAADLRHELFSDLSEGRPPSTGTYSDAIFQTAKTKGSPQLGATHFEPDAVVIEFLYPDHAGATAILAVRVTTPERIVLMPVPSWVVESIWQGEIAGSHHFESEANSLLEEFVRKLAPEENARLFGETKLPTGRG